MDPGLRVTTQTESYTIVMAGCFWLVQVQWLVYWLVSPTPVSDTVIPSTAAIGPF